MSATPRYPSIGSPSLSILASSALICMRAVLRSALIARRGHLGIKKCQSPEQYQATTQFPVQPIRAATSASATVNEPLLFHSQSGVSQKLYYAQVVL